MTPYVLRLKDAPAYLGLCFLKGKHTLLSAIRDNPALADWWIAQERKAQFSRRHSYADLKFVAMSQQVFNFVDEPAIDCHCGD